MTEWTPLGSTIVPTTLLNVAPTITRPSTNPAHLPSPAMPPPVPRVPGCHQTGYGPPGGWRPDRMRPDRNRRDLRVADEPTYNVLKTWASDDWGLYGRGDELLSRALARQRALAGPLMMLHALAPPFGVELAGRLGGRGVTRGALVRRDGRAAYPDDADERQALDDIYRAQIPPADLVWAGTKELVEEFRELNPRTVLHPVGADQGLAGGTPAQELADLPRPLVIYAGSMRAYLNVGLIRGTAERLGEASFVFVGPAADFLAPLVSGLRNV